jgi:molybdopterin-guanine dinucleotide biosynthesis protein B
VPPSVVSIVAKSGTGKTTVLEMLLPALKERGLRVGVLKHHSHVSSFDTPGKDTYRFAEAGADIVVGASPVQVAIFKRQNASADLDAVIDEHFDGMDLVLVEGYRRGTYPKIEIHRAERSSDLLCDPEEMLALVTDRRWDLPVEQIDLNDPGRLVDLLVAHVAGEPPSADRHRLQD